MSLVKKVKRFVRNVFASDPVDEDLDREVRSHLDLLADENLRNGMLPAEARRAATIDFGGIEQVKEQVRDQRIGNWFRSVLMDARFGARQLRKNPTFTAIATLALALGIGFSAIVFSIFYNGVLHPFPYRDTDRLVVISVNNVRRGADYRVPQLPLDELSQIRADNHTFEDIVGITSDETLYRHQGISEIVHGCVVTSNAMGFWGVQPILGRGLTVEDAVPGSPPVVLLGYLFWKKEFQGDKNVVGKTIVFGNQSRTIVGVMPRRFYLFGADFYSPIAWDSPRPSLADAIANNLPYAFFMTGILKRGVSSETAEADLQSIAERLAPQHKDEYPDGFRMKTMGFSEMIVGDFKKTMYLLIASVAVLLFISSTNVAGLLLVHTSSRAREIAVRTALGASRSRLVRQLFLESLVLGTVGCVAGSLVAFAGLRVSTHAPGIQVPGEADLSMNWPVLFFAIAVSFCTVLLFGLSPAFLAVKRDLRGSLQTAGVDARTSQRGVTVRAGLVVGQVALSMVLLVFAGLMIHSFIAITHTDPGIRTANMYVADIHFNGHQYDSADGKRIYMEQVISRLNATPGILHVATSFGIPVVGGPRSLDVTIPGKPHDKYWETRFEPVSEDYFATLGLPLLHGRLINSSDIVGARRVAVVNHTLVQQYFGSEDPIGQTIKLNALDDIPPTPHDAYFEIVGVVGDVANGGLGRPILPQVFMPYTFSGFGDRSLVVRTAVKPELLTNTIQQVLSDIDPNSIVREPGTLEGFMDRLEFVQPRFRLISFSICAVLGLSLALIGLFGVMAYSVTLRTQEFGIRMALGAQRGNILSLVLRKGLALVAGGIVVGLIAALLSVGLLKSQLWGVSQFDSRVLLLSPFALLAAGILACYLPARRATRVDPLVALRYE